jgi:hypothetical protein
MNHNLGEVSTRGHNKKIRTQLVKKIDLRHQFFTNRITEKWNILPVEAKAVIVLLLQWLDSSHNQNALCLQLIFLLLLNY